MFLPPLLWTIAVQTQLIFASISPYHRETRKTKHRKKKKRPNIAKCGGAMALIFLSSFFSLSWQQQSMALMRGGIWRRSKDSNILLWNTVQLTVNFSCSFFCGIMYSIGNNWPAKNCNWWYWCFSKPSGIFTLVNSHPTIE